MDLVPLIIGAALVALAAVMWATVAATRARALGELQTRTQRDLDSERGTSAEVMNRLATAYSERTEARTRFEEADATLTTLRAERDAALIGRDVARDALKEAEKAAALERQARQETDKRLMDWEAAKAETLTHAKAAVLTTAQAVSSKLIADHKREAETARKAAEERVKKTTESLTKHFEGVARAVASLTDQTAANQQTIDTVWRALSSPAGAGDFSEMGLENALKSFGLQRGRDFVIEHTLHDAVESRRFRPDAIVFLPYDSVLVIDSKASKFLLELAVVEGTDQEEEMLAGLARTMNQHLRALAGKDYQGQILESYRASGRVGEIRRILSVMYLPNEAAIERLKRADPEFEKKASRERIIVSGPTGLASIIGFATVEIDLGRQADNQEQIVDSTRQLLDGITVVLDHVNGVGKGLKSAAASFVKLTGSINSRLLPRTRGLGALGVRPGRNRQIPKQLATYQLIDLSEEAVIEGDAADVSSEAEDVSSDAEDVLSEAEDVSAGEDAPAALESPKDDGPTGVDADAG